MKYQKQWKDVEEFKQEHIARLKPEVRSSPLPPASLRVTSNQVEAQRKLLFKKHRCTTAPTFSIPVIAQIPLFVASTVFFSHLAQRPTPLDDEAFWTLTSMARPDATATIPVTLGLVTLANVETAQWFVGEEKRERERVAKEASDRKDRQILESEGTLKLKPRNIIQGGLRVFSVARIIIGTMVNGVSLELRRSNECLLRECIQSVLVYWLSSATFGLVQTWAFNWWYSRKTARLRR